jgi:dUTP pyrophosphatase
MKLKLIDFGVPKKYMPKRAHENDAGADVYATGTYKVGPGCVAKIPLGFGLELPDGYAGFIFPRSGLSAKGIVCELPPIDSGYRGEVHAIVTNVSNSVYTINPGDRVGQLVILPACIPDFTFEDFAERGQGAFGSTGK